MRDPAACAAKRVGGAHHSRQANALGHRARVIELRHDLALGHGLADANKEVAEELAVLRRADRLDGRAKRAHVEAIEDAGIGERHGEVEPCLAAECREQPIRPLALDDAGDDIDRQGLDVDGVGDAFVRHDRGGVRVHEDGVYALLAQRAAGLRAGVVELCGLPDDDRPGADDEDA